VLTVPGLQGRLALQGVKSILSALWILLTQGPDQAMHWYEHIRYNPT